MGENSNLCVCLVVSLGVPGALILQTVCFVYSVAHNLCYYVPEDREYCNATYDNVTNTTIPTRGIPID